MSCKLKFLAVALGKIRSFQPIIFRLFQMPSLLYFNRHLFRSLNTLIEIRKRWKITFAFIMKAEHFSGNTHLRQVV